MGVCYITLACVSGPAPSLSISMYVTVAWASLFIAQHVRVALSALLEADCIAPGSLQSLVQLRDWHAMDGVDEGSICAMLSCCRSL